jgi:Pentapeptide repeats (8 copies)
VVAAGWRDQFARIPDPLKVIGTLTGIGSFALREDIGNGFQRITPWGRSEFDRRTAELLRDDKTPNSKKRLIAQARDGWGLKPLPTLPVSVKVPTSPLRKKLISLAYMDKPLETQDLLKANNDEANKALVVLALEKQEYYKTVKLSKLKEQRSLLRQWRQAKRTNSRLPAILKGSNFSYGDLSHSQLQGLSLKKTQFDYANMHKTNLDGADVGEASFKRAENMSVNQLLKARNAHKLIINSKELNEIIAKLRQNNKKHLTQSELKLFLPEDKLPKEVRVGLLAAYLAQKRMLKQRNKSTVWLKTWPLFHPAPTLLNEETSS